MADPTMQLPAHLAGRRSNPSLTAAMSGGLGQPSHPRISTKQQRFTLVDAAGNEMPANFFDQDIGLYLDVVIVEINPVASRIFYEKEFDPAAEAGPPECFSDNGLAPSADASKPQHIDCASCPWNQWGSEVSRMSGKPVKACGTIKKMAVLVVGDPQKMLYELRCSTVTLKHVRAYAQYLGQNVVQDASGQRPVSPADVVTRLSFDKTVQGVLNFFAVGFVGADMVPLIDQAWASGAGDAICGKNDKPFSGAVLAAPRPAVALPPPAAAAAPQPALQPPPPPPPASTGFGAAPTGQPGFGAPAPTPVGAPAQAAPPAAAPKARAGRRTKAEIEADRLAKLGGAPAAQPAPPPAAPGFGAPPAQPAPAATGFGAPPAAGAMQAPEDGTIPPFLRRTAPPAAPPPAQPPVNPAAQTFGMTPQAAPPPAALADAVNAAFALPIPPR